MRSLKMHYEAESEAIYLCGRNRLQAFSKTSVMHIKMLVEVMIPEMSVITSSNSIATLK